MWKMLFQIERWNRLAVVGVKVSRLASLGIIGNWCWFNPHHFHLLAAPFDAISTCCISLQFSIIIFLSLGNGSNHGKWKEICQFGTWFHRQSFEVNKRPSWNWLPCHTCSKFIIEQRTNDQRKGSTMFQKSWL